MPTPQAVLDLIERFEGNREAYRSGREKTAMRRQRQIDTLVYELYGLTEEEIAVVEGKAK